VAEETKVAGLIALKRILVDPSAPPTAAHLITWTRVGHEYLLDVGHYDLVAAREAISKEATTVEEATMVDLYVTHRFALSQETVERLILSLDELKADMERLKTKTETKKEEEGERSAEG